ncbi:unnamed protein product [Leptidea sinapis]|uniref:K Homology domain-containing protein n=1 Tax=Leptidea sinapis TaxID=189913 RepID=A0A5E4QV32_9NEOP|nr:unnamed protein product [Leptidea sinapis]
MKNEMQKQTTELTVSITKTIMERMDESLQPIIAENKILKIKLENLEKEIETLKRENKQNNLIISGLKEDEKSTQDLIHKVKNIFKSELNINFEESTTERACLITGSVEGIMVVLDFIMEKIKEKPELVKPFPEGVDAKMPQDRDKQWAATVISTRDRRVESHVSAGYQPTPSSSNSPLS